MGKNLDHESFESNENHEILDRKDRAVSPFVKFVFFLPVAVQIPWLITEVQLQNGGDHHPTSPDVVPIVRVDEAAAGAANDTPRIVERPAPHYPANFVTRF